MCVFVISFIYYSFLFFCHLNANNPCLAGKPDLMQKKKKIEHMVSALTLLKEDDQFSSLIPVHLGGLVFLCGHGLSPGSTVSSYSLNMIGWVQVNWTF